MTFFGLLTILFVALKLTAVITWSWWLVICPIFVPILIPIIIGLFALACAGVALFATAVHGFFSRRKRTQRFVAEATAKLARK